MASNEKAMVLSSFIGDALALGVHWIYNTNIIDRKLGRVSDMVKPIVDSWHPTKEAGEFTHYGDQTLVLLSSLGQSGDFKVEDFADQWKKLFKDYNGYIDKATKGTLENFQSGSAPAQAGAASTDLAGAARIAPLIYLLRDNEAALVEAARTQTAMTHNVPEVVDAADFFARVSLWVLKGENPVSAITRAVRTRFNRAPFADWVGKGIDSADKDTRSTLLEFGQMCEIGAAFPSVIHLVSKYEGDFREAMIENCMAGGDSASRGMVLGMLLGAWHGMEGIPENWLSALKSREAILQYLDALDKIHQP